MSFTLLGILNSQVTGGGYWISTLGGAGNERGKAVATDSLDNVYAFGFTDSTGAGNNDFLLAKYNSAGTVEWQRILGGASGDTGQAVAIDSADNVYVFGFTTSTGAGSNDFLLAKYNSSGTLQWQRVLGGASSERGYAVAIDSSNNIYVAGEVSSAGAGNNDFLLAKYNSSGTIQWQRVLGGASNERGQGVTVDSSDNVYAFGFTESTGAGNYDFLLAKYNSSGTIQWQRVLGGVSYDNGNSVAIDSSDNVCIIGETTSTGAGGNDFLLAKLPSNGSLTGTYVLDGVDIVYATSTLTAGTSTLTAATSTLTAATSTLTAGTSTLTAATSTLTEHFVAL
jgi:uncharacterized delta-60 repeat protein